MEVLHDEVLTADEAAAWLKISKRSLVDSARRGAIPGRKVGKEWRFSRSTLEQFLTVQEAQPTIGTEMPTGHDVALPGPDERAGGFAIVGDPETDRTNALLRFLLRDCRDDKVAVALFELASGKLTNAVNDLDEPDFISPIGDLQNFATGLLIRHQVALHSDDTKRRLEFIEQAVHFAEVETDAGPISLIIDDADDLVPDLPDILADRSENLWPTVVWQVKGSDSDRELLNQLNSLMIFTVDDTKAAVFVADVANSRVD